MFVLFYRKFWEYENEDFTLPKLNFHECKIVEIQYSYSKLKKKCCCFYNSTEKIISIFTKKKKIINSITNQNKYSMHFQYLN